MPLLHPALLGLPSPLTPGAGRRPRTTGSGTARARAGLAEVLTGWPAAADVLRDEGEPVGLGTLGELARRLAATDGLWRPVVRHDPEKRWFTRLLLSGVVEVWLIGWAPGQGTAVHDHGGALGALAVAEGTVEEDVHDGAAGHWEPQATRRHDAGRVARFAADHVHRVVNRGLVPATTVHAYSPPELPLRYEPSEPLAGAAR
jgi:predicted metal-dependent enzyme (double-stranded beta helix superfamily)